MQTIKLEIENSIYEDIMDGGIDIQKKFNEFLKQFAIIDDGYPAIGTDEAKRRVAEAVEEYRSGKGIYLNEDKYNSSMNRFMAKLEQKYADN